MDDLVGSLPGYVMRSVAVGSAMSFIGLFVVVQIAWTLRAQRSTTSSRCSIANSEIPSFPGAPGIEFGLRRCSSVLRKPLPMSRIVVRGEPKSENASTGAREIPMLVSTASQ
jgi:hypothetical protein